MITEVGPRKAKSFLLAMALSVVVSFAVASPAGFLFAADEKPGENRIVRITRVESDVEVEVTSSREFPVRNELVKMNIGGREFSRSRSPEDGSLNTLIFILASEQFSEVSTGDEVSVYYGQEDSGETWRFGKLDKGMLDKSKKK